MSDNRVVKKTVRDVELAGRRVLCRVDFNVPIADGEITDDTRIRAALPTLEYMIAQGAAVVLMSHLGRPKGRVDDAWRLDPAADHLARLIGRPVKKIDTTIGEAAEAAASALAPGELLMLENLRFHPGEEANDPAFAASLARLGDIYVNDAFGAAHRAHASTVGVADHLESVAGLLLARELEFLGGALDRPKRPFVAILGGAKVKDKIGVIRSLLPKVDTLVIGGGMGYTFLKAKGWEIGRSLLDEERLPLAAEFLDQAGEKILLPMDVVVADAFSPDANHKVVGVDAIPPDWEGMDIGPKTRAAIASVVAQAATVLWNGPLGVFEMPAFAHGTTAVAKALAESRAITIIGGGDSAAAVHQAGVANRMTHISTGGGASLEFLEGRTLPGVAALADK